MLWYAIVAPLLILLDPTVDYSPINRASCIFEDWKNSEAWQPITSYVEATCTNEPEYLDSITDSWTDSLYTWYNMPYNQTTRKYEWCGEYIQNGEDAIKNLMENVEPYLETEERFITDFMVSGHKRTMEHVCKDGEDALREQVKRNNNVHCNDHIDVMVINAIQKCVPKAPFFEEMKDIHDVMNESQFCSNFRISTKCLIDHLEEHCTGCDFSSFLNTIFDIHLDWCMKNDV